MSQGLVRKYDSSLIVKLLTILSKGAAFGKASSRHTVWISCDVGMQDSCISHRSAFHELYQPQDILSNYP